MFNYSAALLISSLWLSSCATLTGSNSKQVITANTSLSDGYRLATTQGGQTLAEFKRMIKARNAWRELSKLSEQDILKNLNNIPHKNLVNALHLYQISTPLINVDVVKALFAQESRFYIGLAWTLASLKPSDQMAAAIESELTEAIIQGREQLIVSPQMAAAVRANRITSVYSLLRQGLMENGSDEFAKAMIETNSREASWDFMSYLALADLEDLRQINQQSVNMYSCLVILRYFMEHPIPVAHPDFKKFIYYTVSRNAALAEMARSVMEKQIPRFREQFAYWLATEKLEIQMAFVEGARQNPTPNIKLMLSSLKSMTRFREVSEEIDAFQRF